MYIPRFVWVALVAVFVVVTAIVLLDILIETDEELVSATLHQLAADLQRGDVDAVVASISIDSPDLQREALQRMAQAEVHKATVKPNLETIVSKSRNGLVAKASFNGVLVLSDKLGMIDRQTVPRYFVVHLRKEDDRWRISRYEDLDPIKRR